MAEMHARICKNQLYSGKLEQEQKKEQGKTIYLWQLRGRFLV
jgi:hypothetical protein